MSSKINIKNRKASFEYEFIATFVAGMSLLGTEIKSIRNNKANISDAHCVFIDDELYVKSLHIAGQKSSTTFTKKVNIFVVFPQPAAYII